MNAAVLPELARAFAGSAAEAVAGRFGAAPPGGGAGNAAGAAGLADALSSAAGVLKANERAQEEGDLSWRQALSGKSFALRLVGSDAGDGAGDVTVWGAGDWRRLSPEGDGAVEWEGDVFAAHLGVDAALGPGLRAGAAVSRFESAADYADRSGGAPVAGAHDSRMTSVHPYLGLTFADGSRLWATAGYGAGEIEIDDGEAGRQTGDTRLATAAAGGVARLASHGAMTLRLKGEAQMAWLKAEGNDALIAGVTVKTHRLRLVVEASHAFALSPGATLTPSLEAGLRQDGGDGETGAGIEIGGALGWSDRARGFSAELGGRALASGDSGVREWSVSGFVRLDPGAEGRGLSLSVAPAWGDARSGMARLWNDGMTGRAANGPARRAPGGRIDAELGYGMAALGGAGVLTPFAGAAFGDDGGRRWRLDIRGRIGLALEASRRESPVAEPDHAAGLSLRMSW